MRRATRTPPAFFYVCGASTHARKMCMARETTLFKGFNLLCLTELMGLLHHLRVSWMHKVFVRKRNEIFRFEP